MTREQTTAMYIGKVSQLTGVTPKAIRLYESMGLIPTPERKGKYRNYDEKYIELIIIIKDAKKLGFKLSEIKGLMDENISCNNFPWEKGIELVQGKIMQVQRDIEKANQLHSDLNRFLSILEEKKCEI